MSITYPVPEGSRWAVYQVSTSRIVARDMAWPVLGGDPIEGLDPDYVYLLQTAATQPDYDSRYYTLVGTEVIDVPGNSLALTWATALRPEDEQVTAAENVEAQVAASIIDLQREAITTRLMLGGLLAYVVNGQALPAKAKTMAQAYIDTALILWQNRDRLNDIVAAITAGEQPNLDTGWVAAP